jgi:hypothetical protein
MGRQGSAVAYLDAQVRAGKPGKNLFGAVIVAHEHRGRNTASVA